MKWQLAIACALANAVCFNAFCRADSVTITPIQDNSIFQHASDPFSSALGPLISGQTGPGGGNLYRRGLVQFDVATFVPASATITAVQFTLHVTVAPGAGPASTPMTLHRVSASWGEGTSDSTGMGAPSTTNDASWFHRFYSTTTPITWTNMGGDFNAAASATTNVGAAGTNPVWSSASMINDVQGWLDTPATNSGWLIRGDETQSFTARAFSSREDANPSLRPILTITYTPVPEPSSILSVLALSSMGVAAVRRWRRVRGAHK